MYLGLREIRSAIGRFALVGGVVALMACMVVSLSALTEGLRLQSVSAVEGLPGNGLVVQDDGGTPALLSDSELDAQTVQAVRASDSGARELGVATLRAGAGDRNTTVAAFGSEGAEGVTMSPDIGESLGASVGDTVRIGGVPVRIDRIADVGHYAHQPVVDMPLELWHDAAGRDTVNAVIASGSPSGVEGTRWVERSGTAALVPGYSSEHSSLLLIQLLLLVISAVVVCAFFAVWTGQRAPALAVVRAMGAGRWYLVRDGLSQAGLVLIGGLAVGASVGLAVVALANGTVPVAVDPAAVAVVLGAMGVLGLLGVALALRPLVKVDALSALNR
ncbi:FtsX-like permease family protein [Gordonia neofelifaecis]|uniref:ABC3 transporter permease C-terminal domain-containing protein n=1 Tax=Gordonia neofelifaecis NRRL B-59395 TaxID=644548 RepID=F1YFG7_9ACTN|nr:FtsX-like permease family protein [Gordonia neofelifaecis]EGD56455.1 hypothetical protein SCNU_02842 [Gordonia neofelifaecis NRRL B-59395]